MPCPQGEWKVSAAEGFPGGGFMGGCVRAHDWAATPLGPAQSWPQSLRTALSMMLNSAFPTYLAWGPELTSFYNDAYIPIMGDKPNGLGRPFREVWSEVWDTIGPITMRAMRGEPSYFEDLPLTLTRRGYPEPTWFSFSYSPIRDETGGTGGVLCIVHETTRRVHAETRLRRSEARLQAAIDLVEVSPYAWDPATGALEWDARLKAMWGLSPERPVSFDLWMSAIHSEDRAQVEAALAHCLDPAGDGVYHAEYRVIGIEDGIERWVSTHGRTIFENGRPVGFSGAALDITMRKRAETALRESEVRLASILDQLPVGVGLADHEGNITLRNQLLQRYVPANIPSKDPKQARRWRAYASEGQPLNPSDYPIARALRGETVVPGLDFIFTFPDGREEWTRVSAAPLTDAARDSLGAVFVVQDIDREKRAEERFREFAAHSTNVFWIANIGQRTLEYLNPAFGAVFGLEQNGFRQDMSRWIEVVHPDDRVRVLEAFDRAAFGLVCVEEFRIFRSDGAVRWIRNSFFPIRDEQGRVRRTGGIAQDITRHEGRFVYVVDAPGASRQNLSRLLQEAGYDVRAFASGAAFLEAAPALAPGCVVLHIHKPDADGLAVPRELKARRIGLPVVVLGDAGGDVTFGVRAMKSGAVDFLPLPYRTDTLLDAVASAAADIRLTEESDNEADVARARVAEMSEREREVLAGVLAGQTNKQIGRDIGISPRTVETHRAHVMQRLGAKTVPDAVRIAASAGVQAPRRSMDGS
jgi:PAS domain S-box-containing protein